jgi:starch synthase
MPPRKPSKSSKRRPSVLMIGSEAVPFAKTGGLADVLGALPPALARLKWDATLVMPRYRGIEAGTLCDEFAVGVGGYTRTARFFDAPMDDGARAVLVDVPDLYDRDELYSEGGIGYADNARRFGFLVRAALEFAVKRAAAPSIVHAHDWQAGLAPVYLKTLYAAHPLFVETAAVFTIHNLAYQGVFEQDWLPRLDLPWDLLSIDRMEFWGRISYLKGGITEADIVTTVSPRYAQEIQTAELGFGFDGILRHRSDRLAGIRNGIDADRWNPATDAHLPERFDASNLAGKRAAKRELLARFGLPADEERPLVGMISRMVEQKGCDLIAAIADHLPKLGAGFVVLGTGEARYEHLWRTLASQYPDRIAARIGFDEALAHLIEAGSDLFLMPSRFEPCGLNQMYSLRYGTVPVVHAVGGLADTVVDGRTGFVFEEYAPEALRAALARALRAFQNKAKWQALQAAGMKQDYSWDRSAREYVKIYKRASGSRLQASVRTEVP